MRMSTYATLIIVRMRGERAEHAHTGGARVHVILVLLDKMVFAAAKHADAVRVVRCQRFLLVLVLVLVLDD